MEPNFTNIHEKINQRAMLSQFLDIMIEKFQKAMDKAGILGNDIAYNSFKKALFYSGGNIDVASVNFIKYIRMVDMGVGKGMPIGSRRDLGDSKFLSKRERNGQLKNLKRKPKPWKGKTQSSQVMKLREIMSRDYRIAIVQEFEKSLNENININLR